MSVKMNKQFITRSKTDKVFESDAKFKYDGIIDKSIKFINKVQLSDINLWSLITFPFGTSIDDTDNGWRGEYWGKVMRGACRVYEYTNDDNLYMLLKNTVEDIIKKQDSAGRISTYSVENEFNGWDMWSRKYVMLGLLHFYDICKEEFLKEKVLTALCRHLDYIVNHIGDGLINITDTSDIWQTVNSCSILEPVVRLYNITQNKKYLDFASHIVNNGFAKDCDLIELAYENKIAPFEYPVIKAYEMMSCFEGLLEYWRINNNDKYFKAAQNFVNKLIETEDTVIGCLGCRGEHFDNAAKTQADDEHSLYMQETCVTVTWMKLCLQMYDITGNIKYMEQIEKSFYNSMLGSVNTKMCKNEIDVYPFDSYSPLVIDHRGKGMGGQKDINGKIYGCCTAIGAMGLGIVPFISVMEDADAFVFNIYESGRVILNTASGSKIIVDEQSCYPADGKIKLTFNMQQPEKVKLKLRIPPYAVNPYIIINGEKYVAKEGTYFLIDRIMYDGDVLKINYETKLETIDIESNNKTHICFKYGVFVLARDSRFEKTTGSVISKCDTYSVKILDCDKDSYMIKAEVTAGGGQSFTMIDYASAGKTLNENSMMEAWISAK